MRHVAGVVVCRSGLPRLVDQRPAVDIGTAAGRQATLSVVGARKTNVEETVKVKRIDHEVVRAFNRAVVYYEQRAHIQRLGRGRIKVQRAISLTDVSPRLVTGPSRVRLA